VNIQPQRSTNQLPVALQHLTKIPHWVVWRREFRDGRWTKPPRQSKHPERYASVGDPSTWSTYEEAVAAAKKLGLKGMHGGIGFVLTGTDVTGSDLDNCIDEGGVIAPWAMQIIKQSNTYAEVSPSGTGVHLLGLTRSKEITSTVRARENDGRVEIYCNAKRYLTITGRQISKGDKLAVIDDLINELARDTYEKSNKKSNADNVVPLRGGANNSNGGADSSSSGIFHDKVCKLAERGWTVEQIEQDYRDHPSRGWKARPPHTTSKEGCTKRSSAAPGRQTFPQRGRRATGASCRAPNSSPTLCRLIICSTACCSAPSCTR
jgi:primase-polymerase (primpol)-like protein